MSGSMTGRSRNADLLLAISHLRIEDTKMQTIDTEVQTQPGPQPPSWNDKDEISILDLLIILAKRKRFIGAFTLVCAVVVAIISLLVPFSYTASTIILPPQSSSASSALLSQFGSMGTIASLAGGSMGIKNPNDMYVAMFKSRTVEDAMVQRFHLKDEYHAKLESEAITAFESRCDIQNNPKDGLIRISITDRNAARAAEMTNAYVDEYRKLSGHLAITEASQRRLFFEQQLADAKDKLGGAEEALKQTQQKTGMIQMDSQARTLIESAASLRAQIAAKEVEIQGMRSFASEGNPDLVLAQQQLAGWKAQLSRLTGSQNAGDDDLLLSKGQVPGAGLEYVRKLRDVKYYDTIFELLAKQFEMAKLDEARQGSLIQVIDPAIPPDRRSSPKRTLMVLGATLGGLFISITWVLITAVLANVRNSPENKEGFQQLKRLLFTKRPLHS
jgi:tyrosine-protein kinase Etk/Wzc